ncbi:class I adenylate-forming enzyme family protein [Streptomyces luteogriseus]|uniref:class I adenylate-forming enzyme family protein n=1 Tax=Streptomyces luteogriseus TaxID=68233 RepID=UPI00378C5F58
MQTTETRRLRSLARTAPARPLLSVEDRAGEWVVHTAGELYEKVIATADFLRAVGLGPGRYTVIALPNGEGLVRALLASWAVGCTPMVLPQQATAFERQVLSADLGEAFTGAFSLGERELAAALGSDAVRSAPRPAPPGPEPETAWYLPTGGTTGLPGLSSVTPGPSAVLSGVRQLMRAAGWSPGAVQLSTGPLSHAAPLMMCMAGIGGGAHVVMPRRLDPGSLKSAVRRYSPTWCHLTPHQMALIDANQALWDDLCASLCGVLHMSAPCPEDVKRRWITRLSGERLYETYSCTQLVGATFCDGVEWLAHPGTVGRPLPSNEVLVADEVGRALPPGEVGEVFMRSEWTRGLGDSGPHRLRGHGDGYLGVGDCGYTDDAGYLYLTGRLDDVVLVGGANVNTREVESVLLAHPRVSEVVVVQRPEPLMGSVLHAVVVPDDPAHPPTVATLQKFCDGRISAYKIPVTADFVDALPRSHAGKVERFWRA